MDGWPSSWRSLTWLSLAADAAKGAVVWTYRAVTRHLLHETPRMKHR